ncbi:MAG: ABC transporter substrate-binding protein, partial [Caulobacter sp.]
GLPTADLVWSSAMDMQVKLINDGLAQAYASPEKPNLPQWAMWKNEGWGLTAEPIVFAYNRARLAPADVPRSHEQFETLLRERAEVFRGRVITYDPQASGVGFLYLSQDARLSRDTWKLVRALGSAQPRFNSSTSVMIDELISGRSLIAYNAVGSYVLQRIKREPQIGVIFPSDYTLLTSRIAFIHRSARHPNSARLLLDHLLSRRGQQLLARESLGAVRLDLPPPALGPRPAQVQAVRVGPDLLANLDQIRRARVLREWRRSLERS